MKESIFNIKDEKDFEYWCLKIFRHQYLHCVVYRNYVDGIGVNHEEVMKISDIPFLPIQLFKSNKVVSDEAFPEENSAVFSSSATTGMTPSHHYISDLSLYEKSFLEGFRFFYGDPSQYCFLALLPSYLEREGSSLVYMVSRLIELSNHPESGFYLYNREDLHRMILSLKERRIKVVLFGVAFALLDYANEFSSDGVDFSDDLIVIETGGMKGRAEELTREELHRRLSNAFGVKNIHSEYGMCELLSQGYSTGDGTFMTPTWMKILIRDLIDPFSFVEDGVRGGINIIDLANINSCSFIETEDLGRVQNGKFTIEGRIATSERRGCNMLLE